MRTQAASHDGVDRRESPASYAAKLMLSRMAIARMREIFVAAGRPDLVQRTYLTEVLCEWQVDRFKAFLAEAARPSADHQEKST